LAALVAALPAAVAADDVALLAEALADTTGAAVMASGAVVAAGALVAAGAALLAALLVAAGELAADDTGAKADVAALEDDVVAAPPHAARIASAPVPAPAARARRMSPRRLSLWSMARIPARSVTNLRVMNISPSCGDVSERNDRRARYA